MNRKDQKGEKMEERGTENIQAVIQLQTSRAETLLVSDNATYLQAGNLLSGFKEIKKQIEAYFKPMKESSYAAWKKICERENEEIAKLAPGISHLNKQMTDYNLEQERLRKEEELRLRREAEKIEEERRLAAAIEAEKAGSQEEAMAILDEPVFVPPPLIEKTVPKIAGQTMVASWKWKLVNIDLVPRQYLTLDEIAVNGAARSLKERAKIPGIEFYCEQSMRGVRKS